jgi:hypothetical protein
MTNQRITQQQLIEFAGVMLGVDGGCLTCVMNALDDFLGRFNVSREYLAAAIRVAKAPMSSVDSEKVAKYVETGR